MKESTKWFLDAAGVSFRVTFDDVMMFMTLFVLFADNIRLMTADKSVDDDFIVVNSICLVAFIIELIANTWSKTDNMYFDFYTSSMRKYGSHGFFATASCSASSGGWT